MSEQSLKAKIKELRELQRMAEELAQEIETIKDVVKAGAQRYGTCDR